LRAMENDEVEIFVVILKKPAGYAYID